MLEQFKNFIADRMTMDQLIGLAAFGRQLRAEYEAHQVEEPNWVDVQLKALRREIAAKNSDALAARKSEINARLDGLKTPAEKKADLLKEKKKIDEQLAAVGS